jgi:hypothetical protein
LIQLSRRNFLQMAGIAVLSSQFAPLLDLTSARVPTLDAVYGRALEAAAVLDAQGRPVARLWPDSILPIVDTHSETYRIESGWVDKTELQPMMAYSENPAPLPAPPYWAEVAGAVAAIRQQCAAEAELVTRIGHGGVLRVVDAMTDGRGGVDWLGVEGGDGVWLGWTQAQHWRAVDDGWRDARNGRLEINLAEQTMTAFEDDRKVLRASISTGNGAGTGEYRISGRQAAGMFGDAGRQFYGVAWPVSIEGMGAVGGVYWHNDFGKPAHGPTVQVSPLVARWLYEWLGDGATVVIS